MRGLGCRLHSWATLRSAPRGWSPLHRAAVRPSSSASSTSSWRIWTALEERDEQQKLQLARLLQELSAMAADDERAVRAPAAAPVVGPTSGVASLSVVDTSQSAPLTLPDELPVTRGVAADAIMALRGGATLEAESLLRLLASGTTALLAESSVIDLREAAARSSVHVVGDLHGSIECFSTVLGLCDAYPHLLNDGSSVIIFNGDFVDRGEHSVEVLACLLLLKLAYPAQIVMLRGNHECSALASAYGFLDEVRSKYPHAHAELWTAFTGCFAALPLLAITRHACIMHGGLPTEELDVASVAAISPAARSGMYAAVEATDDASKLVQGLLWSDPTDSSGVVTNESRGGAGALFGSDVTRRWLQRNGLRLLVRSHQMVERGWEAVDCGDDCELVTVFSSAGYPDGNGMNLGAVLQLSEGGRSYSAIEFAHQSDMQEETSKRAERTLLELIVSHRHRLAERFATVAAKAAASGSVSSRVTTHEWAAVMAEELQLPIDWLSLQPSLVPTVQRAAVAADGSVSLRDTGLIDCARFLDGYAAELERVRSSGGGGGAGASSRMAEVLHANHSQLTAIFSHLDTDGNGKVSRKEWEIGVTMLNERLPPERQLPNASGLFDMLDLDGSGELELDEFADAFQKAV